MDSQENGSITNRRSNGKADTEGTLDDNGDNIISSQVVLTLSAADKDDPPPPPPLSTSRRILRKAWAYVGRPLVLIIFLYFFICSLDLMSSAFRLIGGKAAGTMLKNNLILENPVAGLMIGVLITVAVQSSSTSTSIFITMVAAEILSLRAATFMIMGANIGTSVTNTIVSLGQVNDREEFRLAFAGATVHDMFNWLTVITLLPLEAATWYLTKLSALLVNSMNLQQYKAAKQDLLKVLTKPLTKLIIQLDSKIISNPEKLMEASTMIKWCCKKVDVENNTSTILMSSTTSPMTETPAITECREKCVFMFIAKANVWSDELIGGILLVLALALLIGCLIGLVKILKSMLASQMSESVKRVVNTKKCSVLMGYVSILVGALLTILVQSSSVFTSALTPLVGTGFLTIERMYPLTLGSNIGTTITGVLAALASDNKTIVEAMRASMIHLFFNISGIIIWYPIPFMRNVPIRMAKHLGKTTSKYRWFAAVYLILMFVILPGFIFGLSLAWIFLPVIFVSLIVLVIIFVAILKLLQRKRPSWLPVVLRDWKFLPRPMRSLAPYDELLGRMFCCRSCKEKWNVEYSEEDSVDKTNVAYVSEETSTTVIPEIISTHL